MSGRGRSRLAFRIAAALAAGLLSAAPALALCPICNASVRLDANLASCFAQRAEVELARLRTEGHGFVIVDLSDCPTPLRMRNVLPTAAPEAESEPLDATFVADDQTLQCLSKAIADNPGPMEPSYLFDLAEICTP